MVISVSQIRIGRRLAIFLALFCGLSVAAIVAPPLATAHVNTRYYSIARLSIGNLDGARANMNQQQMFVDPWVGYDHINNVLWLGISGGYWVEMGYRNGYDPTNPCNCIAYQQYRGEFLSGNYVRTTILNTVPDNSVNTFEMERVYVGPPGLVRYEFRRNGAYLASSASTYHSSVDGIDVGGELAVGTGDESHNAIANTFSNDSLRYSKGASSAFLLWPGASSHLITVPCGSTPHCMNANQVNNHRFDWNKP